MIRMRLVNLKMVPFGSDVALARVRGFWLIAGRLVIYFIFINRRNWEINFRWYR